MNGSGEIGKERERGRRNKVSDLHTKNVSNIN